uniref:Uncharacterized protein n=1 Tax=Romanomermis culicivorax TaxID=13658 RepID=A0A915IYZ3_ROMCU
MFREPGTETRRAKQYPEPLPTISVTVPVKPYALKDAAVKTSEGRLMASYKKCSRRCIGKNESTFCVTRPSPCNLRQKK